MKDLANSATDRDALWFGNTLIRIAVPSATGPDGLCVVEHTAPHGDAPPLHVHHGEDELFIVLEGMLRMEVGGRTFTLGADQQALAPKGVPHRFRVESAEGARLLTVTRGSDFETMLRATSRPALTPTLPEPVAPSPEMIAALTAACAANRIDIIGPPMA